MIFLIYLLYFVWVYHQVLSLLYFQGSGQAHCGIYVKKIVPGSAAQKVRIRGFFSAKFWHFELPPFLVVVNRMISGEYTCVMMMIHAGGWTGESIIWFIGGFYNSPFYDWGGDLGWSVYLGMTRDEFTPTHHKRLNVFCGRMRIVLYCLRLWEQI